MKKYIGYIDINHQVSIWHAECVPYVMSGTEIGHKIVSKTLVIGEDRELSVVFNTSPQEFFSDDLDDVTSWAKEQLKNDIKFYEWKIEKCERSMRQLSEMQK